MYTYCIHGLNIQSSLALKEKQDPFNDTHIKIEWLSHRFWRPSVRHHHELVSSEKQVAAQINKYADDSLSIDYFNCGFFYFKNLTLMLVRETTDNDFFHAVLTTQILPLIASLKYTTLHGGAVSLNQNSAVFVGPEGFGKSTLTTYLQKKYFNVISDDVVSIDWNHHDAIIYSGLPEIRLHQDSAETLKSAFDTKKNKLAKWSYSIKNFENLAHQLKTIFVLNPQTHNQEFQNTILSPPVALQHLLKNQFRLDVWDKEILKREFADTTKILKTVAIRELSYPFEYSSLEWLEQQIRQGLLNDSQIDTSI
ncbi:hypothetical protein K2X05_05235 [bacterium]|nr:hypothetical protein [bacterium]